MKKTGNTGSVAKISIESSESFTIEELMYVYSYSKKIDDLYGKLRLIYDRSLHGRNDKSYTEWAKAQKVDTRLMGIMKMYGFCGDKSEWILDNPPRKADAVFLQLKIRNSYKDAKS